MTAKRNGKNFISRSWMLIALVCVLLTLYPAVRSEAAAKKASMTLNMTVGEKTKLKVRKAKKKKVKWSSSNKAVATVSKRGKVVARSAGEAMIKAKVSGKRLYCKVYVSDPVMSIEVASQQPTNTTNSTTSTNTQTVSAGTTAPNVFYNTITSGMISPNAVQYIPARIYYMDGCMYVDGYLINTMGQYHTAQDGVVNIYLDGTCIASAKFNFNTGIASGSYTEYRLIYTNGNGTTQFVSSYNLSGAVNCMCRYSINWA